MRGVGGDTGVLRRLESRLEAEQERWFGWLPVLIGCGIGAYFELRDEPTLAVALAPLAIVLAWRSAATPRATLSRLIVAVLLTTSFGFALAKLRVESVAAPVLTRQMSAAEVHGWVELIE